MENTKPQKNVNNLLPERANGAALHGLGSMGAGPGPFFVLQTRRLCYNTKLLKSERNEKENDLVLYCCPKSMYVPPSRRYFAYVRTVHREHRDLYNYISIIQEEKDTIGN